MLEEGADSNEEMLEVTREREAPDHISLDQALALTSQHARDNRDFYGLRYPARDRSFKS